MVRKHVRSNARTCQIECQMTVTLSDSTPDRVSVSEYVADKMLAAYVFSSLLRQRFVIRQHYFPRIGPGRAQVERL